MMGIDEQPQFVFFGVGGGQGRHSEAAPERRGAVFIIGSLLQLATSLRRTLSYLQAAAGLTHLSGFPRIENLSKYAEEQ
jgi:hypothetical protein